MIRCFFVFLLFFLAASPAAADDGLGWGVPDFGREVGLEAQAPWVFASPSEDHPYYSWRTLIGGGWTLQMRSQDGGAASAVIVQGLVTSVMDRDTLAGIMQAVGRAGRLSERDVAEVMAMAIPPEGAPVPLGGLVPRSVTRDGRTLVVRMPRSDDPRVVFAVVVAGAEGEFLRLPGDPPAVD